MLYFFGMEKTHIPSRDVDKISSIIPFMDIDSWVDSNLKTRIMARVISRDFHYVSTILFFSKNEKLKRTIKAIEALEDELFLENIHLKQFKFDRDFPVTFIGLVNVRIVSAWCARYYRALLNADAVFYTLLIGEFDKQIGSSERKFKVKNILLSINNIKKTALNLPL